MALDQIGQKLKAAREGQGLTLVQVYERTKIPLHHLQSIDQGVTDDLPEPVYVAGFIKRYADVVGLNGQALSDEYRRESAEEKNTNGNGAGGFFRGGGNAVQQQLVVPAPYLHKTRIETGPPNFFKTIVFPFFFVMMCVGLVAYLVQLSQKNNASEYNTDTSALSDTMKKYNSVAPTTPAVPPMTATQTAPAAQQPQAPTAGESQVTIVATKHVWVEVKAMSNNDSLFTGFLENGDRRDFKDPVGIRVHAGNGGSLTVESEGKKQPLGANGKISEKTFVAANPNPAAATPVSTTAATSGSGPVLGTAGTTTVKPIVKKVVKKPVNADGTPATPKRKYRPIDEVPARRYIPGEGLNGTTRPIPESVPYRYTEGRLDTD